MVCFLPMKVVKYNDYIGSGVAMKKLNDIRIGILRIPVTRIILLILTDCFAILAASVLSLFVRYEFSFMAVPQEFWEAIIKAYIPNLVISNISKRRNVNSLK